MFRRITVGIMASGAVLFIAAATGLTGTGFLVVGTLLLTAASLLLAISLDGPAPEPWRVVPPRADDAASVRHAA